MRRFILVALTLSAAAPLPSQQVVRWQSAGFSYQGKVEAVATNGQVTVNRGSDALVLLSPDTLPSLAVRHGGKRSRGNNALIGMAIGAVIGGAAGFASGDDECGTGLFGCLFTYTAEQKAGMLAATGGLLGLLIGAVVVPAARWVPWEKGAIVARVHPVGGFNAAGEPKLGLQISF
ncbi:MAG: hypothetical protein V4558_05865 [Gemmatimonadota bacterium]